MEVRGAFDLPRFFGVVTTEQTYAKIPLRITSKRDLMCSGRESNPYGHFCPRDFKSRVSTYSTTRAIRVQR